MSILPKAIYRFNAVLIKLQMIFFHRARTNNFTICMEIQKKKKKTQIAKAILRKKNGIGGINQPDFMLYYKATVFKRVWYWHKDRNIDHWKKAKR